MNFATLQGLTIPEGVVTQITDASGRVIWAAGGGDTAILEVAKLTSDTYAGETTYTGEEFILLDIYPKTNGTVKVTYGGLTKTIKDTSGVAEPNAQQVFFGTFNGVSDSVSTPASGKLTIEGDYYAFGNSTFDTGKLFTGNYAGNIVKVLNFGKISALPVGAFKSYGINIVNSFAMTSVNIPKGVTRIEDDAFYNCHSLKTVIIPDSVTSIASPFGNCYNLESIAVSEGNGYYFAKDGVLFNHSKTEIIAVAGGVVNGVYIIPVGVTTIGEKAFYANRGLTSITISEGVTRIEDDAFYMCANITAITFANTSGWQAYNAYTSTVITLDVTDPANNVTLLTQNDTGNGYCHLEWTRT